MFIAGCIGTFDRSTGFCRIRQSKRGDDCRVYGGHGGATKTRLISNVKSAMISLVNKGSYRSYGLLLVIVMLGASLAGTGATGYYVLILSLVSTIPYSKSYQHRN